jgi:hypothetical protein
MGSPLGCLSVKKAPSLVSSSKLLLVNAPLLGVLTDSITAASIVNTGTSSSMAMKPIGALYAALAKETKSYWAAVHTPGSLMVDWGVDRLSRLGIPSYESRSLLASSLHTIMQYTGGAVTLIGIHPPLIDPRIESCLSVDAACSITHKAKRARRKLVICSPPHQRIDECIAGLSAGFNGVFVVCPTQSISSLELKFKIKKLNVRDWTNSTEVYSKAIAPPSYTSHDNMLCNLKWPKEGAYDLCKLLAVK